MSKQIRSLVFALAIGTIAPIAACNDTSDPAAAPAPRTVASMVPRITRSLTPAAAEERFGKPDEITGSGLLIYVYRVEEGKKIHLGFPGFAPIIYATVVDASGGSQALTLRD